MSQLPLRSIVLGVVAVLISVLIVACGTSPGSPKPSQPAAAAVLPVPVTTEFRVGDNRTVFSLLDPAGKWIATFTTQAPGSAEATIPFSFDVRDRTTVISPGDPAPSVTTPTLAEV